MKPGDASDSVPDAPRGQRPSSIWKAEFDTEAAHAPHPAPPEEKVRLARGPMAADVDQFQPARRAGRGSSGDPSEIAPPRTRAPGEPGTGKWARPEAAGRTEPGTGKLVRPVADPASPVRAEPGTGKLPRAAADPTAPVRAAPGTGKLPRPADVRADSGSLKLPQPGTGKYPLPPAVARPGEPATPALSRPTGARTARFVSSPDDAAPPPREPGTGGYAIPRETPRAMMRQRTAPEPSVNGPLLEPNQRRPQDTPPPVAAEPEPVREVIQVDEDVARAVSAANQAARSRKRLGPDELASFTQALDSVAFDGEGEPGAPPALAVRAPSASSAAPVGAAPAAATTGMPHYLIPLVVGEPIVLDRARIVRIGRSAEGNDLIFPLGQVSRTHAEVRWDQAAASYVIIDRTSANGTFVNGKPIKRRRLGDGDRIGVGPFTIVYRISTGGARVPTVEETEVIRPGSLTGEISEIPVADVCRLIETLRKTGELCVVTSPPSGAGVGDRGTLFFRDGKPVHAEWKVSLGVPAAVAMLRLKTGCFRFSTKPIDIQKASVNTPLASLLNEAAAG